MVSKWRTYARIAPVPQGHYRDDSGNIWVWPRMVIFLPDFRPNYAIGKRLVVITDTHEYWVYNPQKLRFEFNEFMSHVKTNLLIWGEKFESWEIVDEELLRSWER